MSDSEHGESRSALDALRIENAELRRQVEESERSRRLSGSVREAAARVSWRLFLGKHLDEALKLVFSDLYSHRLPRADALADLVAALIRRLLRVGSLAILLALLPGTLATILFWQQNGLLSAQNNLLGKQNARIDFQIQQIRGQFDYVQLSRLMRLIDELESKLGHVKGPIESSAAEHVIETRDVLDIYNHGGQIVEGAVPFFVGFADAPGMDSALFGFMQAVAGLARQPVGPTETEAVFVLRYQTLDDINNEGLASKVEAVTAATRLLRVGVQQMVVAAHGRIQANAVNKELSDASVDAIADALAKKLR